MTVRFAAGLLLCTPLPWLARVLHRSAQRLNDALPAVATGRLDGPAGRGFTSPAPNPPVVRMVEENHPPDRSPVVTPPRPVVKAGPVRRVPLAPPCHDFPCCRSYAERLDAADREVTRLRGEIERADARRINTGPLTTAPPSPVRFFPPGSHT